MIKLPFTVKIEKNRPHKTRDGKIGLTLKANKIDAILDVGANIGQTHDSLRAHGFKGPIISIEPLPALQAGLQAKAKKDKDWTVLPPLALGDKDGDITFHMTGASDLSSMLLPTTMLQQALPNAKIAESVTVPMKTLDSVYAELEQSHGLSNKNVFIKIDAQGAEKMILTHAPETLKKIKGIQIELSLFPLYEGEALYDELLAYLQSYGFKPHMLVETNFNRRIQRQLQIDAILYKDEPK